TARAASEGQVLPSGPRCSASARIADSRRRSGAPVPSAMSASDAAGPPAELTFRSSARSWSLTSSSLTVAECLEREVHGLRDRVVVRSGLGLIVAGAGQHHHDHPLAGRADEKPGVVGGAVIAGPGLVGTGPAGRKCGTKTLAGGDVRPHPGQQPFAC